MEVWLWFDIQFLGPLYLELIIALGKQTMKRVQITTYFFGTFLLSVSLSIQAISYHLVSPPIHPCIAPSTHTLPLSHSSTHLSIYLIHPSVSPFISLSVLNSSLLSGGTKVGKTAFWKAQEERPWGESEVSAFRQKPPEVRWSHKLNPRFTHTFLQPRPVGSLWAACSSTNSLLCFHVSHRPFFSLLGEDGDKGKESVRNKEALILRWWGWRDPSVQGPKWVGRREEAGSWGWFLLCSLWKVSWGRRGLSCLKPWETQRTPVSLNKTLQGRWTSTAQRIN